MNVPQLLALDWGTSSLRAFLLREGRVLQSRHAAAGLQQLGSSEPVRFEWALQDIAGDWLQQWLGLPAIACGMVGSAQGWREAPYAATPVDPQSLGALCVAVEALGRRVHIVPGVLHHPAGSAPDVMRGEETQVAGAVLHNALWRRSACFVLPGTHSKWVDVVDGRMTGVRTFMTGELFSLLKRHSILGRLMPAEGEAPQAEREQAFAAGVQRAQDGHATGLLNQLFSARTLGLTGLVPPAVLADYLSGLLIGAELVGALAHHDPMLDAVPDAPLVLVGEDALCEHYAQAFRLLGRPATARLSNTAPGGLWAIALGLGLVQD